MMGKEVIDSLRKSCVSAKHGILTISNWRENSKQKLSYRMTKLKPQTHQTNRNHMPYSWLGTGITLCRKCWINPKFYCDTQHDVG